MNVTGPDLSALISTRICHDLINPIGAINNGLELLGGTRPDSPELGLVADSAALASAKLSFFRLAFGNASLEAEIGGNSVGRTVEAMYTGGRFRPVWQAGDGPLRRIEVKLALLLLLGVEVALKVGGTCTVARENRDWRLHATGPRVEPNPELWKIVTDGTAPAEMSAKEVQFAVAAETAARLGRPVSFKAGEAGIIIRF